MLFFWMMSRDEIPTTDSDSEAQLVYKQDNIEQEDDQNAGFRNTAVNQHEEQATGDILTPGEVAARLILYEIPCAVRRNARCAYDDAARLAQGAGGAGRDKEFGGVPLLLYDNGEILGARMWESLSWPERVKVVAWHRCVNLKPARHCSNFMDFSDFSVMIFLVPYPAFNADPKT